MPLLFAPIVACDDHESDQSSSGVNRDPLANGGDNQAGSVRAAILPELTVPANTIVADAAGVLSPTASGSLSVGDRGDAHEHIPIWVPPGRAGIQPELALEYSTGGGNGFAGAGWGLAGLPRITRCKRMRQGDAIAAPILWNEGDTFCIDGEPLVADSDHSWYRKFHDDGSLIIRHRASMSDIGFWRMLTKDGRIYTFGGTPDSRVIVKHHLPADTGMTYALSRIEDRAGNFMTVSYVTEQDPNGPSVPSRIDILPSRIDYTGSASDPTTRRSVTFVYDVTRPDIEQRVVADQYFTYPKRLARLEMRAPNSANLTPLRTFSLRYTVSATTGRSLLSYIAECDGPAPSSIPVTGSTPLCRQQTLTYAPGTPMSAGNSFDSYAVDSAGNPITDIAELNVEGVIPNIHLLDVNGDGRDDLLYLSTDPSETYRLRFSTGTSFGPPINTGIPVSVPAHLSDTRGTSTPIVLDFDGDGHADILVNQGPLSAPVAHLYLANLLNGAWVLGGAGHELQIGWNGDYSFTNFQSADVNGDSRPDLIMMKGNVAYYSINQYGTLSGLSYPVALPTQTRAKYNESITNYFLDLNNDGVTEAMTRMWTDDACIGKKTGDYQCDCSKIRYGALDIAAYLYENYYNSPAQSSTGVGGLTVCTGTTELTQYTPLFGDFNGDGVVDVIEQHVPIDPNGDPQPVTLELSLGSGNQDFTSEPGGTITIDVSPEVLAFQTADIDLDGKTDLVVRGPGVLPYTVYSWKNQSWQKTVLPNGEDPSFYVATQHLFATGDVNGDGVADFVAYAGDGNNPVGKLLLYIRRTSGPRADLLTGVKGDFGPTATIRYAPYRVASNEDRSDCLAPLVCVTRAGFLVSQVDVDNGIASTNVQHHTYASGRADALGWGFLGF
ncbi:MAG TPA: FG-GAP-like repeat-containing protein, partial [Kofleriaceae bacterium]